MSHSCQWLQQSKESAIDDGNERITFEMTYVLAERELGAFTTAVARCYGTELRQVAADLWLNELLARTELPAASAVAWREISSSTAARLAVHVPPHVASTRVD